MYGPAVMTRKATRVALPLALSALTTSIALVVQEHDAHAQQMGYTADRLILAPNPDDGFVTARPVFGERTRFFGSATVDYINRPLRIQSVTSSGDFQAKSPNPISRQINGFATFGVELLSRLSVSGTLPITLYTKANDPGTNVFINGLSSKKSGLGDFRVDARLQILQTDSKKLAWGVNAAYFSSTGDPRSFTGDVSGHSLFSTTVEERVGSLILDQWVGVHLRDKHDLGELSFRNELVFGASVFVPLRDGRVRIGGSIYGQTGLNKPDPVARPSLVKESFFKRRYTPVEWLGEARFGLGERQRWWAGGGFGTMVVPGYSAPDFRVIAQVGYWFDIKDSDPPAPARRMVRDDERVPEKSSDRDGDGIPDAIDACPDVPEDHKQPDPNDGCPLPPDRDGDGIPDAVDKCPDVPEDKDGIDDDDGCPEDDVDKDGIPDAQDACPREPGKPSKDPKKNGCPQFIQRIEGSNEIRILQKIEFDTGKATIKPVSFPILDEVVQLLKANPTIKKLSIEGHTDNRGGHDMNMRLSDDRAKSVLNYLSTKGGIDAGRLSSQGFGPDKPIDTNDTDAGRQKNRRVEFHIVE